MDPSAKVAQPKRAKLWFWVLVLLGTLGTGALSSALAAPPGVLTGLSVAASGLVVLVAITLAARILAALERARRRATK